MWLSGVYLCVLAAYHISVPCVKAEPASLGFVSIDCGLTPGYSYTDKETNITYVSDDGFINTGENKNISLRDEALYGVETQQRNLRVFPDGDRNCYTINSIVKGGNYLVRANFLHGNYDGSDASDVEGFSVIFNISIGYHHWETLDIRDPRENWEKEVIHNATDNYLLVCLLNIKKGIPFISSLEVRPLRNTSYEAIMFEGQSLNLYSRVTTGQTTTSPFNAIRYPFDPYDRKWYPSPFCSAVCCDDISSNDLERCYSTVSTSNIKYNTDDNFEVPSVVLQNAVIPINNQDICLLPDNWGSVQSIVAVEFIIFHFADFQRQKLREFKVYVNGLTLFTPEVPDGPYSPPFLKEGHIFSSLPTDRSTFANNGNLIISFNATEKSQLPPILSAIEFYTSINTNNIYISTLEVEVEAMFGIRDAYKIKRNWVGDPCSPAKYKWDGVTCSSDSLSWRVQSINLSTSGLHGAISDHFSQLRSLQTLDLSYNTLNGTVPDSLIGIPSLRVMNLTGNQFYGEFPRSLCMKRMLSIRYGNGDPCITFQKSNKKKSLVLVVSATVSVTATVLLSTMVLFCFCRYQGKRQVCEGTGQYNIDDISSKVDYGRHVRTSENRVFTYEDIVKLTENFTLRIGEGGFGPVFKGQLKDGTLVAVKICSQTPTHGQGIREFFAEVESLTKVHHRHLVQLVGYCTDKDHLALIYEYMPNGNINDHLRGNHNTDITFSWQERARIAVEAAQGLDYLHTGCVLPIIHRDVKPHNILLGKDMRAKISDFGLSRSFVSASQTHISVTAAGTPGYMDPEYYLTSRITESSDVFSFGVVLLEMVTGEPPIMPGVNHITQRVRQMIRDGNISAVVDPRLKGDYDINSVWTVVDVALMCTMEAADARPTMATVVAQLNGALALEEARVCSHAGDGTQDAGSHGNPGDDPARFSDMEPLAR